MTRRFSIRSLLAHLAFAAVAASLLRAFLVTGATHIPTVYVWAPRTTIPESLSRQVSRIQTIVPGNVGMAYIEQDMNGWQMGLWKRALYPNNTLLPAQNTADLEQLKKQYFARFALIAGPPPDWVRFRALASLPAVPGGVPIVLGELQ